MTIHSQIQVVSTVKFFSVVMVNAEYSDSDLNQPKIKFKFQIGLNICLLMLSFNPFFI